MRGVPDIDLDFPRDIREKLIVRVTERYGREHAALVATLRDVPLARRDPRRRQGARPAARRARAARAGHRRLEREEGRAGARDAPRRASASCSRRAGARSSSCRAEIAGLPRHISQHPGGMVISSRPLVELVPVQPAAMAGRQLCQWDKDSLRRRGLPEDRPARARDALARSRSASSGSRGCAASRSTSRASRSTTRRSTTRSSAADTVGVFQIESRAQMQSLLRTRPENLDDLTVQVALVRPGPIQGKAVHPYIEHREALRADPTLRAAGRPPAAARAARATRSASSSSRTRCSTSRWRSPASAIGEAEGLRRAMSRKRSQEALEALRARFVEGALAQRRRRGDRRRGLRQARRLLGVRLPEVARRGVRAARVPVGVAAPLLPDRVPLRAPERAADGLLPAVDARARRAAARGRGAPARREPLAREVRDRGRRRAGRARIRQRGRRGGRARARRGARANGPFTRRARARAARPSSAATSSRRSSSPARATAWGPRRSCSGSSGSSRARRRSPAPAARSSQLALPLEPTAETPELPRADALGADARRLPPDVALGRRPPARAAPPAPARRNGLVRELRESRIARASRWRAWRSRDSARRPRRASSSCCSRTSTAR